jgi:hypothetical protein
MCIEPGACLRVLVVCLTVAGHCLIRHTGLLARELPPSTFEGVDCEADSRQSLRDA